MNTGYMILFIFLKRAAHVIVIKIACDLDQDHLRCLFRRYEQHHISFLLLYIV